MTYDERRLVEGYLRADEKTRVLWCRACIHIRGYMYCIDVAPTECLDVLRGLWLTGGIEAISLRPDYLAKLSDGWEFEDASLYARNAQKGGYSER